MSRTCLIGVLPVVALLCSAGCTKTTTRALQVATPASPGANQWVETTLAGMSLREKLGQMFIYHLDTDFKRAQDTGWQQALALVENHRLGGFHLWNGEPHATAHLTNRLQAISPLPLLFTADLEHGTGQFRGTNFPPHMALAATGNPRAAYAMGWHTAREARAIGIHLIFAPVADVNNNPENPIINVRSFGEDPETVAEYVEAFVRGCREGGGLATAKHFPGHGDTQQDSHRELAYLGADSSRLEQVELVPFRRAIAAGVDFIMTAHVNVRGLSRHPYAPATLAPEIMTHLLRDRLRFEGVLITDAMQMWAVSNNYTEAYATVAAVQAGIDIILAQENLPEMIAVLERHVRDGRIPESRIDQSVRRILAAKARLNLHQQRFVDPDSVPARLGTEDAIAAARDAAARCLTLLQNEDEILPLQEVPGREVVCVSVWDESRAVKDTPFTREVGRLLPGARTFHLHPETCAEEFQRVQRALGGARVLLLPIYARLRAWKGTIAVPENMQARLETLLSAPLPAIAVSFGNPYLFPQVQKAAAYLVAYDDSHFLSLAAARALVGQQEISGRLPVTIPGFFARGSGLALAPRAQVAPPAAAGETPVLRHAFAGEAGMRAAGLDSVHVLMQQAVRDSVFPGAVLLVSRRGKIVLHEAYGRLGYGSYDRPMPLNAVFDLASVTKVVATTTACMLLYERGVLDLDAPVQSYLPDFTGKGKEKVTVRHLLTHSSGLVAYRRFHAEKRNAAEIVTAILQENLAAPPGTQTVYSDLGLILLGKILERASGKRLDEFCHAEIFAPLGMQETAYNPPAAWLERIPPTEIDTVTAGRKGQIVHGVVHDENAHVLGGVSAHAGLFASARDLAIFLQMLLNGGNYHGVQLLAPETIAYFTRRQELVPGSSRALGWDTADGKNSAGKFMSPAAFGHTGFTGTSVWVDPQTGLMVILLSNRVHPTRENKRILSYRGRLHDAVVRALSAN